MRELTLAARLYVAAIVGLAGVVIASGDFADIHWPTLVVLALLFLVCESVPTLLNVRQAAVSLSFSAALASVILLGPTAAALVSTVAVISVRPQLGMVKRIYNGAQFALCAYAAGAVYQTLGGPVGVPRPDHFPGIIGPFAAATMTFVVVNFITIGAILALTDGGVRNTLQWGPLFQLFVSYLGYGTFGLLIAALWAVVGPFSAVLVLVPLFIARWAFGQYLAQQRAYDATIAALCQAVETKDYYTRGHSERVSKASVILATELGLRPERTEALRYAGMLHDVGKLGVPTKVLQKSGPLTEEEFAAIQLHPMRGLEIVREIGFLDEALAGITHHHERMDGRGYPMGLAGEEIPEFARIIAVADAFDSMTSTRSYRDARTVDEAIGELYRWSGAQFDPVMVEAFVRAVKRDGWEPPKPIKPPVGVVAETTAKDHDDPMVPIQVVSESSAC